MKKIEFSLKRIMSVALACCALLGTLVFLAITLIASSSAVGYGGMLSFSLIAAGALSNEFLFTLAVSIFASILGVLLIVYIITQVLKHKKAKSVNSEEDGLLDPDETLPLLNHDEDDASGFDNEYLYGESEEQILDDAEVEDNNFDFMNQPQEESDEKFKQLEADLFAGLDDDYVSEPLEYVANEVASENEKTLEAKTPEQILEDELLKINCELISINEKIATCEDSDAKLALALKYIDLSQKEDELSSKLYEVASNKIKEQEAADQSAAELARKELELATAAAKQEAAEQAELKQTELKQEQPMKENTEEESYPYEQPVKRKKPVYEEDMAPRTKVRYEDEQPSRVRYYDEAMAVRRPRVRYEEEQPVVRRAHSSGRVVSSGSRRRAVQPPKQRIVLIGYDLSGRPIYKKEN